MISKRTKRFIPLVLLVLFALILYLFDLHDQLNINLIKAKREELFLWIREYPVSSTLLFIIIYTLSVCLIIPDSTILSLVAGMLYPMPVAVLLICFSEMLGAILFFMIIRYAFSEQMIRKQILSLHTIEKKYQQNPASYLLFFRFSHLIPFWLVNLLAVTFKTKTWTFIWTTFICILPLSILLVQAGRGFEKALEKHASFSFHNVFNTPTKLSLLALGLLALLPIFIKKIQMRKRKPPAE
jgi:uncharacterized membrane protein YdjX (TVP38/TMEM64 family)